MPFKIRTCAGCERPHCQQCGVRHVAQVGLRCKTCRKADPPPPDLLQTPRERQHIIESPIRTKSKEPRAEEDVDEHLETWRVIFRRIRYQMFGKLVEEGKEHLVDAEPNDPALVEALIEASNEIAILSKEKRQWEERRQKAEQEMTGEQITEQAIQWLSSNDVANDDKKRAVSLIERSMGKWAPKVVKDVP